jgi:DNA-binding response OmpR family regulator
MILVVDDEQPCCDIVSEILRGVGYQVQVAYHASEGLEILKNVAVDLILLDRMMPSVDGLGLLLEIRSNPATKRIPVLVTSAKTMPDDQSEVLNAGANGFLAKPFSAQALRDRVNELLPRPIETVS